MTLDILILLIIITYFVKDSQYELANYMKKHEIVNKIESKFTWALIKVLKRADYWATSYDPRWNLISWFFT